MPTKQQLAAQIESMGKEHKSRVKGLSGQIKDFQEEISTKEQVIAEQLATITKLKDRNEAIQEGFDELVKIYNNRDYHKLHDEVQELREKLEHRDAFWKKKLDVLKDVIVKQVMQLEQKD